MSARQFATKRLGEIVTLRGGGTPPTNRAEYWRGDIPWVSPKDMKFDLIVDAEDRITPAAIEASATNLIPASSCLVVVRSGILARTVPVALTIRDVAVNQDIKALSPSSALDPKYLFYFLRSVEPVLLRKVTRGATVHRLATGDLRDLEIPLRPLVEQKRIVAILDQAFEGIAKATSNAERNLANARELFATELNTAFELGGEGWLEGPLGQFVTIKHGFAFKSEFFVDDGNHILLTPGNFFEGGGYRDRGAKQKFYRGPIPDGFILADGDLLVAMTEQAPGLLGSPMIVPEDGGFLHNQRLGLVQPKPGLPWVPHLFEHIFNTRKFRDRVHADGTGVKVRHTSPDKLNSVRVRFPATSDEQRKLSGRLSHLRETAERLEGICAAKLELLSELKQSLLHRVFAGQVTSADSIAA